VFHLNVIIKIFVLGLYVISIRICCKLLSRKLVYFYHSNVAYKSTDIFQDYVDSK